MYVRGEPEVNICQKGTRLVVMKETGQNVMSSDLITCPGTAREDQPNIPH